MSKKTHQQRVERRNRIAKKPAPTTARKRKKYDGIEFELDENGILRAYAVNTKNDETVLLAESDARYIDVT